MMQAWLIIWFLLGDDVPPVCAAALSGLVMTPE